MKALAIIALSATAISTLPAMAASEEAEAKAPSSWELIEGETGNAVYTTGDSQPGLIFGCNNAGRLSATINLEGDIASKLALRSARNRRVSGPITVGEKSEDVNWTYLPGRGMVVPIDSKISRRIYNAVVTTTPIGITVPGRFDITIDPPAVDETFKKFVAGCSVTNG